MRLTPQAMADMQVWLFGSRVDDVARGGYVDLYMQTSQVLGNCVSAACQISAQIQKQIGLQKIDMVLRDASMPDASTHQVAQEQGVRLC